MTLCPRSRYVWTNPRTSSHTHTLGGTLRGLLLRGAGHCELVWGQRDTAELSLGTHTNSQPGCGCVSGWVSLCLAVSQTPRSNQETTPVFQLTVHSSILKGRSSEPRNVPSTRHPDPTQHSHLFVITGVIFWLLTNAIVTHKGKGGPYKACRTESEYTYYTEMLYEKTNVILEH